MKQISYITCSSISASLVSALRTTGQWWVMSCYLHTAARSSSVCC